MSVSPCCGVQDGFPHTPTCPVGIELRLESDLKISILEDDARVIETVMHFHEVNTVLEFGPGESTRLFKKYGAYLIDTLEDNETYFDLLVDEFSDAIETTVFKYTPTREGRVFGLQESYDMAFVDGPVGTPFMSRISTVLFALQKSGLVLLHDSDRLGERQTLKYLEDHGHRITHFGTQKGIAMITYGGLK
jgi:hypothetical protein